MDSEAKSTHLLYITINVSFKGEHKIHPNQMVPDCKKVLSDKNRIQTKNNKKIKISF